MKIEVLVIVVLGMIAASCAETNELVAFACKAFNGMFEDCKEVDGEWATWTPFTVCTSSCVGGTRTRNRTCDNPSPANGGSECPTSIAGASETEDCNADIPCPVNGGWGNWGAFAGCSKTCGGGTWTRQRICNNPTPANGGATCPNEISVESQSCKDDACPEDGNWGSWTAYTDCSQTCGGGSRTRTRQCNDPEPRNGGATCDPSGAETDSCNTQTCLDAVCETKQNYVYDSETNICIGLHTEKKTYDDASDRCTVDGAFLFKMDTTAKLDVAKSIIEDRQANQDRYFIGARDVNNDDTFKWIDGTRVTWIGDAPTPGNQNCARIAKESSYQMDETSCTNPAYFFCQVTVPTYTAPETLVP